jgi:uncharacterized damage-inducible protein DinB
MIGPGHARIMARYNQWQNDSLYKAADGLGEAARAADRGAFFGSIQATLNHLLWGDRIWMSRFAGLPKPTAPNIPASVGECGSWEALKQERAAFDPRIVAWADSLTEEDLTGDLSWFSGAVQRDVRRPLWLLVTHFFNHQTHHRGQVHAMLTAAGAKPDDTDLFLMPESYRP